MKNNPAVTARAKGDLVKGIMTLENHLKTNSYFVGKYITLADIAIATVLILPLKLVLDNGIRKKFPNVMRWFDTCVHQKEFSDVVGEVTLCKKTLVASAANTVSANAAPAKKDNKKNAGKKDQQKRQKQTQQQAPAKKAKNPLDLLPKSSFVLDAWKRTYSNSPDGDCFTSMPWFWDNLDTKGYCIYFQKYKFNDELEEAFKVSNLVGGFIQRSDGVRKYAFGVMSVVSTGSGNEIIGCWLIRGDSIKPLLEANPEGDLYEWEKAGDLSDEATRKRVAEYWCSWTTIDGKKIEDGKVFK